VHSHPNEEVAMRIKVSPWSAMLLCSLLTLSSLSPLTLQAAEPESKKAKPKPKSSAETPSAKGKAPAGKQKAGAEAKAEEDLLKVCLSRIPANSSAGQRLLAEQGCRNEQKTRASSGAARQF
jgi:hypothetical protein